MRCARVRHFVVGSGASADFDLTALGDYKAGDMRLLLRRASWDALYARRSAGAGAAPREAPEWRAPEVLGFGVERGYGTACRDGVGLSGSSSTQNDDGF